MSRSYRVRRMLLGGAVATLGGATFAAGGCAVETTPTTLRALERSGRVSFVCLGAPGVEALPGMALDKCGSLRFESPSDFAIKEGKTTQPHLYALVTQTTRGEVAVIDMSTKVDAVLDENPYVPGASFLPIGAQPVDIASTEGGNATFVAVAEAGREGIFALPSTEIRPCEGEGCKPPSLSSWPACALPVAPGEVTVVYDPLVNGKVRASCDGTYEDPKPPATGDGKVDLSAEGKGRAKIVVTLPDVGVLAVIDAQSLLERTPGSFDVCPIERWVPLQVDLPVGGPPPPPAGGPACATPAPVQPDASATFTPRPAGLALAEDRLFVGDLQAPVIHAVDMKTPCEPIEREPLLPSSLVEPARVVTTSQLSVSQGPTGKLQRFLYAVDDEAGSVMVFDVGPSATTRRPLARPRPEWTPLLAPDRVEFGVPVQDVVLLERDVPQADPATGVAPEGIRCNPDPRLEVCTSSSASCDLSTLYRSSSTYDRGAGPPRMRGAFAYVLLGTGQMAIVDVDDYDALCRAPTRYTYLQGCPPTGEAAPFDGFSLDLASTGEASCNVVIPHAQRSANYVRTGDRTGQNQPGLQNFPLLYDRDGTLKSGFDPKGPVMRATLPASPDPAHPVPAAYFNVAVGAAVRPIDPSTGLVQGATALQYTLAMNLENPRSQLPAQTWTVTYEGALPGFIGKAAKLSLTGKLGEKGFFDASSRFCDAGVLGQKAWEEMLAVEHPDWDAKTLATAARSHADYIQILENIPGKEDAHWSHTGATCSYQKCIQAFGTPDAPQLARDVIITEAYQDRLLLGEARQLKTVKETDMNGNVVEKIVPVVDGELTECCFPTLVNFDVHPGHQWAVIGDASGFLHHVIATPPETAADQDHVGVCRNSCESRLERLNGRVRPAEPGEVLKDGDPRAFINPVFRFSIDKPSAELPRNTRFQFATQGTFRPLVLNLAANSSEIQPQALTYVPSTGELAITDGSLEGLILINPGTLALTRQYY